MKKKILLALIFLLPVVGIQAQENKLFRGKEGQLILPEQGDIGLGVNMIPLFYWLGNSFNSNTNNTYAGNDKFFSIFGNSIVIGKYMLTDRSALRLAWGINLGHSDEDKYVRDDAANDPTIMVKDSRSIDWAQASLAVGHEWRRGKGRLQGLWGADVRITYNQSNDYRYYYGNGYSLANLVPTTYDWGTNINGNRRRTTDTGKNVFGAGIRIFGGVEYYIAPKVCIGAEFGWGVMYHHTLAVTVTEEYYEPTTGSVILEDVFTGAQNAISAGVDNFDGTVYMMFFFNSEGKGNGGVANNKKVKPSKKTKTEKTEKKEKKKSSFGNTRF